MPLDIFEDNFEIFAVMRCKKSGSRRMPKKDFQNVKTLIIKKYGNEFELSESGKIILPENFPNKIYLENGFYLAKKDKYHVVRKLSNTNNPCVIFSLKYIGKKETEGLELLTEEIKKLVAI